MFFQDLLRNIEDFWEEKNFSILKGSDMNVGAGTLSPLTAINVIKYKKYNIAYAQYCRRQQDGRFAENSNRVSGYYQFQVIAKPAPDNIQDLCIESIKKIGIDTSKGEIKFIEDNWKNPSIGASGVGYEMWYNGMEVLQFTYMQKLGGVDLKDVPCELTYGLERLCMYLQKVDSIFKIKWDKNLLYSDVHSIEAEKDLCFYYQSFSENNDFLMSSFYENLKTAKTLVELKKCYAAYEVCLSCSNLFNILDARSVLSDNKKQEMILQIRSIVKEIACFF